MTVLGEAAPVRHSSPSPSPGEGRRRSLLRSIAGVVLIVVVGGLLVGQGSPTGALEETVVLTAVMFIFALGWNVIGGYVGQFAFGNAAFFGVGAYIDVLLELRAGIPPVIGVLGGALGGGVAALAIGLVTLRLKGLYFGLGTAVVPIVLGVVAAYAGLTEEVLPFKPSGGLLYFFSGNPRVFGYVCVALAGIFLAGGIAAERSHLVRRWRAVGADDVAAAASGVRVVTEKQVAFVISGVLAGLAGALYALETTVVVPSQIFALSLSVTPVLICVFGGLGSSWGVVIGACILVPLGQYLDTSFGAALPGIGEVTYGAVLVVAILFAPRGIYWKLESYRRGRGRGRLTARLRGSSPMTARPVVGGVGSGVEASTGSVAGDGVLPGGEGSGPPALPERRDWASPARSRTPARTGELPGALVARDVSKHYGGLQVLRGVTLSVATGEVVGLIGPNGAGKTTFIDVVSGIVAPDGGALSVGGRDTYGRPPRQVWSLGVGRTFQAVRLFNGMTAFENVYVAARARWERKEAVDRSMEALGRVGLDSRYGDEVTTLSTGQQRRVELARAYVSAPKLLLLDEFLGGLGGEEARALAHSVLGMAEQGIGILAVEHTVRVLFEIVHRVVVLDLGEVIADGSPDAIVAEPKVVEAYLGKRWASRA